ncbi:unnamed protein product [Ambrosiozyma monospora]|uniref:Unnamed protein product n=1 Tax=Ambrosiozyma monospora TaxID=43982 RepID=A0A9W6Z1A6_AMBMO|nr:unnamed protein product [Ambrosiozyma monospora]
MLILHKLPEFELVICGRNPDTPAKSKTTNKSATPQTIMNWIILYFIKQRQWNLAIRTLEEFELLFGVGPNLQSFETLFLGIWLMSQKSNDLLIGGFDGIKSIASNGDVGSNVPDNKVPGSGYGFGFGSNFNGYSTGFGLDTSSTSYKHNQGSIPALSGNELGKTIGLLLRKLQWPYRLGLSETILHLIYLSLSQLDMKLEMLQLMLKHDVDLIPVLGDVFGVVYRYEFVSKALEENYGDDNGKNGKGKNETSKSVREVVGEVTLQQFKTRLIELGIISEKFNSDPVYDSLIFNTILKQQLQHPSHLPQDSSEPIQQIINLIDKNQSVVNIRSLSILVDYFIKEKEPWNAIASWNYILKLLRSRGVLVRPKSVLFREQIIVPLFSNYETWFKVIVNSTNGNQRQERLETFQKLMKFLYHNTFIFIPNTTQKINLIQPSMLKDLQRFYKSHSKSSHNNDCKMKTKSKENQIDWLYGDLTKEDISFRKEVMDISWPRDDSFAKKAIVLGFKA